jgi:hypothetical protein
MSDIAHHVQITNNNGKGLLHVDGYEFPWIIKDEPKVQQCGGDIEVTLTMYTEGVTITYGTTDDAHTPS